MEIVYIIASAFAAIVAFISDFASACNDVLGVIVNFGAAVVIIKAYKRKKRTKS